MFPHIYVLLYHGYITEHLWGILKQKAEVHKVSNIRQLRDVVMEAWKSIPVATCEALVNVQESKGSSG